mgnify:CR=1 FL=1
MKQAWQNQHVRRWIMVVFMTFMLIPALLITSIPVQAESDIVIQINGQKFESDVAPQVQQGRVLLPMRLIFEALGAQVDWDAGYRTVTAEKGSITISLAIGSSFAKVNGEVKTLDTPAIIEQNRTLVPVRFVAESLGSDVQWDGVTRTVFIRTTPIADTDKSAADTPQPTDTTGKYISGDKIGQDTDFAYKEGKSVRLKAGSTLGFHKNGCISEGRLAANTELEYGPNKSAVFKGGSNIAFNTSGYVIKGELAEPTTLEYAPGQALEFKAAPVEFINQAYISVGTPAADCELRFRDGVRTLFQGEREVAFYPNGNVKRGIPKRDAYLAYNYDIRTAPTNLDNTDGISAVFKAGTEVSFYQDGKVEKGILYQNTSLAYNYNQYLVFKGDTEVVFGLNGYINKGVIRDYQYLPYRDDKYLDIAAASQLVFEDGKIKIATLIYNTDLEYRDGKELKFLADTEVEFDSKGYVRRGTLEGGSKINYDPNWQVLILGGREVEFNRDGFVHRGYLADYFQQDYATYKEHNRIEFDDKGKVVYGTLRESNGQPIGNDLWVKCKEGTEVYFHPNYYLKEGTLKQQEKLAYGPDLTNIRQVRLQAGSKIYFTDRGYVSKGTLFEDTLLEYADKKPVSFWGGTEVEFYSSGYVKSGIITQATEFKNNMGELYNAAANSRVYFDNAGLLERIEY